MGHFLIIHVQWVVVFGKVMCGEDGEGGGMRIGSLEKCCFLAKPPPPNGWYIPAFHLVNIDFYKFLAVRQIQDTPIIL